MPILSVLPHWRQTILYADEWFPASRLDLAKFLFISISIFNLALLGTGDCSGFFDFANEAMIERSEADAVVGIDAQWRFCIAVELFDEDKFVILQGVTELRNIPRGVLTCDLVNGAAAMRGHVHREQKFHFILQLVAGRAGARPYWINRSPHRPRARPSWPWGAQREWTRWTGETSGATTSTAG